MKPPDVTFLLMGALATSALGRARRVTDIDLFVRGGDVPAALAALGAAGFETLVVSPNWLAKGLKDDVLVDVISRSTHDIALGRRAPRARRRGRGPRSHPAVRGPGGSDRDEGGGDGRGHGALLETLDRSIEGGSVMVRVGPDGLLRSLVVRLRFGLDESSPLAEPLEDVVGTELLPSVEIARPNRPVDVRLPAGARPISELPSAP